MNMEDLKNNNELKESKLYNSTLSSLTELFYRDIIIVKNIDNRIESKKRIQDFFEAINDCNPFHINECEHFMNTFSSNSKEHESIRQWITKNIDKYSFYKPIQEQQHMLKKVIKNNETIIKIDIQPEHLFTSGHDTFYILLCLSKEIPNVMTKKFRNQLTKYLRDNEKIRKKGLKRLLNANEDDNANSIHDKNENNNEIKKRIKNISITIKKLLIFDLNGVLIYTRKKNKKNNNFTLRPNVLEFIDAMSKRYQLAVWTSKTFERAGYIVQQLFKSYDLLFTWYNDKCDRKHGGDAIYMIKDLRKVWDQFNTYDDSNTILLDDSEEKCIVNNSYNCIHPRRFIKKGTDHIKNEVNENNFPQEDDELITYGNLYNYLDRLSSFQGSVSSFVDDHKHYNDF